MANRAGQNRIAPTTPRAMLPPVVLLLSLDSALIWLSLAITCAWIAVQSSVWSPGCTTPTGFGSRPAQAPSIAVSASALTILLIIDIVAPFPRLVIAGHRPSAGRRNRQCPCEGLRKVAESWTH